jgi:hypothetical protein
MFMLGILLSAIIFISPSPLQNRPVGRTENPAQPNWVKIELERFSFYVPPELKLQHDRGIDSAVWSYAGKNLKLIIDLGRYSGKPTIYESEPDYREEQMIIDGKKAVLCFYRRSTVTRENLPYSAAVYFSEVKTKEEKLSFYVAGASPEEQEIARKIFLSIDFKD